MSRQIHDAVIANGASQSSIIDCGSEYTLMAVEIPSSWTAADITFLGASHTGTTTGTTWGQSPQDALEAQLTFRPVIIPAGTEYTLVLGGTGDKIVAIPEGVLEGIQFLKIRSGTSAAPVNQGAARTLRCTLSE